MSAYQCVAPGCSKEGKKKCSKCANAHYCSPECQKADWKKHKKECAKLAISAKNPPHAKSPDEADEANAAAALQPGETNEARVARLFSGMRDGSLASTGITRLDLSGCGISELPDEIASLRSLEFLSLGKNPLSTLPDTFHSLKNLRILFFLGCHFTEVPAVVGKLPSLYMLSFKANRLQSVPEGSIPPSVCWLIFSDNAIEKLPQCVCKCVGMRKLLLAGNKLTNEGLPDGMRAMQNLELVRLADNNLRHIPQWLLTHPKIAWLALAANPVTDPWAAEARNRATEGAVESFEDVPLVIWDSLEVPENSEPLGKGASGEVFETKKGGVNDGKAAVKVYAYGGKTSDGRPEDEMTASVLASKSGCDGIVRTIARFTKGIRDDSNSSSADSNNKPDGLVMEFLDPSEWKNLGNPPSFESVTRDTYADSTRRTFREVVSLARCIADAGCKLHKAGVHHGDLYAHNVLWRSEEVGTKMEPPEPPCAKLSDFGAAFFYPPLSPVGQELERTEVRAFGVLLHEALLKCTSAYHEYDGIDLNKISGLVKLCLGPRVTRPSFLSIVIGLRASTDELLATSRCMHHMSHYIESFNSGNIENITSMLDPDVQVFVDGALTATGRDEILPSYVADFAAGKKVSSPGPGGMVSPRVVECDLAGDTVDIQISLVKTTRSTRTTLDVVCTYKLTTMTQIKHEISNVVTEER